MHLPRSIATVLLGLALVTSASAQIPIPPPEGPTQTTLMQLSPADRALFEAVPLVEIPPGAWFEALPASRVPAIRPQRLADFGIVTVGDLLWAPPQQIAQISGLTPMEARLVIERMAPVLRAGGMPDIPWPPNDDGSW